MKRIPKLLLFLSILIAGIYAAIPLWLPHIMASQLPAGWTLEKLDLAYPGFSGITAKVIQIKGELQTTALTLTATDVRFKYKHFKIEVDSLLLDVFVQASANSTANSLTLDDLSLPVARFSGQLPELTINRVGVALHFDKGEVTPGSENLQPLLLEFMRFRLLPNKGDEFYVSADVGIAGMPQIDGRMSVDVNKTTRKANLRFPADSDTPAWLNVSVVQADTKQGTATTINLDMDSAHADQVWLDLIVAKSTGGLLTGINGKLAVQADFAGHDLQGIERLLVGANDLRAEFEHGTLILDGKFQARRNGANIAVSLPEVAEIQFQDSTGMIDRLIQTVVPGLQRKPQSPARILTQIGAASTLSIQLGSAPSMTYNGSINIDAVSTKSSASLQATDLQVVLENLSVPGTATVSGLFTLALEENTPVAYISDSLNFRANKISIKGSGQVKITSQGADLNLTGEFEIQNPLINLTSDGHSPGKSISADQLILSADLTSVDGRYFSSGNGIFLNGHVSPDNASAAQIMLTWEDMDLINLTGKLSTKTQGFAIDFDGQIWNGFDLDIAYELTGNADVNGSGLVNFDSGPQLPIKFNGSLETEHWNIRLLPASVELAQVGDLLRTGHVEIPDSITLSDGYVELQGEVLVADQINAKITIKGHELDASMLESNAHEAAFILDASYAGTISVSGPVTIANLALAGGVDVTELGLELNIENADTIGLTRLRARVFEGEISLSSLRLKENRIDNTTVELSHISLGRLLAFADIEDLEGTGHLDFSLPIGSDQTGVFVENGVFKSTGSGHIAYTKEGVAGSNIGLQALENFQYKSLSGTVNYQSSGDYQISIRLEGKNPDLYGGHPIVFNLNIGGSLPEFFKAMFITGSFEESILKQIQTN